MAAIRRTDTKPEIVLRRALHARGKRYRKDFPIRTGGKLIRPDIAFTRLRIAVFVDGCFWHSCPKHGQRPKNNTEYWSPKLARNVERDRLQTALLQDAGWTVIRFWEHESTDDMVSVVVRTIRMAEKRGR